MVLLHPDSFDETDSDRTDAQAQGSTASGGGMLLHHGQQLSSHPLEPLPSSRIPQWTKPTQPTVADLGDIMVVR